MDCWVPALSGPPARGRIGRWREASRTATAGRREEEKVRGPRHSAQPTGIGSTSSRRKKLARHRKQGLEDYRRGPSDTDGAASKFSQWGVTAGFAAALAKSLQAASRMVRQGWKWRRRVERR